MQTSLDCGCRAAHIRRYGRICAGVVDWLPLTLGDRRSQAALASRDSEWQPLAAGIVSDLQAAAGVPAQLASCSGSVVRGRARDARPSAEADGALSGADLLLPGGGGSAASTAKCNLVTCSNARKCRPSA